MGLKLHVHVVITVLCLIKDTACHDLNGNQGSLVEGFAALNGSKNLAAPIHLAATNEQKGERKQESETK